MSGVLALLVGGGGGMTVTLSDTAVFGSASAAPGNVATVPSTESTTATVVGGVAPYSYQWTRVNGDVININSPTSATTTFAGSGTVVSELNGTYRCTVTAANGLTASADCTVQIMFMSNL